MKTMTQTLLVCLGVSLAGCSSPVKPLDAGQDPRPDAGIPDAGRPELDGGSGDAGRVDGGFSYRVKSGKCSEVWQRTGAKENASLGLVAVAVQDTDGDGRNDLILSEDDVSADSASSVLHLVSGASGVNIRDFPVTGLVDSAASLRSTQGEFSNQAIAVQSFECSHEAIGDGGIIGGGGSNCRSILRSLSVQSGVVLWESLGSLIPADDLPSSISAATDSNGDGKSELLRRRGSNIEILNGASGTLLSNALLPPNASVYASVTEGPDLDNDGRRDWLVSDSADVSGNLGSGALYAVKSVTCSGCTPTVLWSISTPAGIRTAASLGDINNDGTADIVAGSPNHSVGDNDEEAQRGRVIALNGKNGQVLWEVIGRANDDTPRQAGNGSRVKVIADLDGDAVSDVLVSAPVIQFPPILGQYASIEIRSGKTGSLLVNVTDDMDSGAVRIADELGKQIEVLGDVYGDALPEFGAAALRFNESRGAFVVLSCRP